MVADETGKAEETLRAFIAKGEGYESQRSGRPVSGLPRVLWTDESGILRVVDAGGGLARVEHRDIPAVGEPSWHPATREELTGRGAHVGALGDLLEWMRQNKALAPSDARLYRLAAICPELAGSFALGDPPVFNRYENRDWSPSKGEAMTPAERRTR